MKIAFFSTSAFGVPIFESLAGSMFSPALVVTAPARPAGRGNALREPPLKAASARVHIPVIQPERLTSIPPHLEGGFDLFIVASYGKILPKILLDIPKHGNLNVHPSLLPRWRGASPIQSTLLAGDTETGVTIMLMDEKVDHGPILKSERYKIVNSRITAPELEKELSMLGARLLLETIPEWIRGTIAPEWQDESKATFSKILAKEDGHIKWADDAVSIERMVGAYQPWPGAYAFWQQGENRIRFTLERVESRVERVEDHVPYGMVSESRSGFMVKTGRGALNILRLKPEGGRSMTASDFLRGHRAILGAVLE